MMTCLFLCAGDLNCIAGATSRNGAFIWDVRKGKIITRFNEVSRARPRASEPDHTMHSVMRLSVFLQHGKNGIFCISWSHKDSKRIATCSGDGFW